MSKAVETQDTPRLEAIDVARTLGGRPALRGASLALYHGRLTALLGASGAGKSTLLRVFAGLEGVDSGEVRGDGNVLTTPKQRTPPEHRNVGVVFQDYALFPHLNAAQNVTFALTTLTRTERDARAHELLSSAGLGDRAGAFPHELSGGEQQRITLLRALANTPRAVLMDEPFSNLDSTLRRSMAQRALDILSASNPAVLLVTHHAEEAMYMADELALMHDGRIIQTGAPRDVYLNPVSLTAAQLTGPVNTWTGRVSDGRLATPFGDITAAPAQNGHTASAMVRTDGVHLTAGEKVRVTLARPIGARVLVEFQRTTGDETVWRAHASLADAPQVGDTRAVTLDPDLARVLPVS